MVDLYEETVRKRERAFDALVTKAIAEAEEEKRAHPKTPETLLASSNDFPRRDDEKRKPWALMFATRRPLTPWSMRDERRGDGSDSLRVVFDTNLYFSAFRNPEGVLAQIFRAG